MSRHVLITGGAGFIGSNLAHRMLSRGRRVVVVDNLSRPGVEANLQRLMDEFPRELDFEQLDMASASHLRRLVRQADEIYHLAAQVAVTTSLDRPMLDFETNVRGTINLLEAARSSVALRAFLFTSTNKVYGSLGDLAVRHSENRYQFTSREAQHGVSEQRPLDFHTPYGCSKGAADQYVLDYARSYRLPSMVFRMSCIYGPRQCGTEDQGWVAHFILRSAASDRITLYGDGMQVRDVLFVDDLLDAFALAVANVDRTAGQPFNIGGGPALTTSLLELLALITEVTGTEAPVHFAPWRQGDQRCYISDIRKFRQSTGWHPRVGIREGISRVHHWLTTKPAHALLTA